VNDPASDREPGRAALRRLCLVACLVTGPAGASGSGDFETGVGMARRDSLELAAEAGDAWAQLNLGAAFDHGLAGFASDPSRAVYWYRRAADAGLAEAQFNLAHCLATGSGTPRDDVEAFGWMLRAAQQGLAEAQFLVGMMFSDGIGTTADPVQARRLLVRAATGGNGDAAAALARMPAKVPGD